MRIDVWGALRVTRHDGVIGPRDFPGAKPKQLLEILVAERGHTVSKSRLADLLWPDEPPKNYLATLESYISVMRQTIEPGVRARDSVVMTERGGYRLDDSQTTLDIEEFDQLVGAAAGLQPVAALETLNAAIALVRGPILEDEPYSDWAGQLRSTYGQKYVQVLIDAGRLALMSGEAGAALTLAEQAVSLDPLAEAAYQVQMTACYALWRQEDALRAFDRCRTLLADELGVDPMDETVALHLAILRHEDVAALLPRPVRAAAPVSVSAPTAAAGLLGRTAELGRLEAAVTRALTGHFTIMLVVGDSGIGKTTLAEALAERVSVPVGANRCSDLEAELPYVALSLALRRVLQTTTDHPMPVVTELLRRSDLDEPFDQLARMRVLESLATAVEEHSPFLLVLDDVQWADPETIAALGYLRRRCPTTPVAVLITADRAAVQGDSLRRLAVDLRVDLTELSPIDLAEVGEGAFAATDGHPMFVADWLEARRQGLSEGFTPALRERVIRQCWDLGPQAYRLLTVAALLNEPFSPALLGELVGASGDVVDELDLRVDSRLLSPSGESFRFRQPLVRQILAETFSAARRAQLLARADNLTTGTLRRRQSDSCPQRRHDELVGPGARVAQLAPREVVGAVGQGVARSALALARLPHDDGLRAAAGH